MAERDSDDSDAPEEFTAQQGLEQDKEMRKIQRENKNRLLECLMCNLGRVVHESKERRRRWAQRITPRPSRSDGDHEVIEEVAELHGDILNIHGMLSNDIVNALVASEKQVFQSDSEEEDVKQKPTPRRKKQKQSGPETVILKELPPAECVHSSLDFLKKRKMQVSRSASVLKHSNQALRLVSKQGVLNRK